MRSPFVKNGAAMLLIICLTLGGSSQASVAAGKANAASTPTTVDRSGSPVKVDKNSLESTLVPLEKDDKHKDSITQRRPMVDAGLRYSSNDWLVNFITTPASYVLRRIRWHMFANIVSCLLIIYYHELKPTMSIPMTGHSLLASSLGLLLSYRTNSAYSRFWEARGHWTDTKSVCRNLAIMIKTHIEVHSPKASAKLLDQLAAYPATLMHLCLGGAARLPDYAMRHMPNVPIDEFQRQPAWPAMLLCAQMQESIHEAEQESKTAKWNLIEAAHHNYISHQIDHLLELMSKCEKILRTPVPWTYSRHTSRFLSLWLLTLPLALVGTVNKWLVLPISAAAGYCMLGIEEIGHLIEQPFVGDPLDGDQKIFVALDEDGEASEIITRGRKTLPYDIGIPVCSLALQIRKEVEAISSTQFHSNGNGKRKKN